jgi:hypothetical protein
MCAETLSLSKRADRKKGLQAALLRIIAYFDFKWVSRRVRVKSIGFAANFWRQNLETDGRTTGGTESARACSVGQHLAPIL